VHKTIHFRYQILSHLNTADPKSSTDGNQDVVSKSSLGPTLPPREVQKVKAPTVNKVEAAQAPKVFSSSTENNNKRKIGTAADGKWTNYSVDTKARALRKKSSSKIQFSSLTRVERMKASLSASRVTRILMVAIMSLSICLFKEGEYISPPSPKTLLQSRQNVLSSCSKLVSGGPTAIHVDSIGSCVSSARLCGVNYVKHSLHTWTVPRFVSYSLNKMPMVLIAATSMTVILLWFCCSYIAPSIFIGSECDLALAQQNDGNIMTKVIKMLPPKITSLFYSIDLAKSMINSIFLDAGFYIIIMVVYQLLPLAMHSS